MVQDQKSQHRLRNLTSIRNKFVVRVNSYEFLSLAFPVDVQRWSTPESHRLACLGKTALALLEHMGEVHGSMPPLEVAAYLGAWHAVGL